MPKIKLSALISDMKGKANGSVFASNNGGVYFRNNPRKIAPNNAINSIRQSQFLGNASQWRNLTVNQQDAWRNAVTSFPTFNVFGDARTPSGYELFCRLNGAMALRNLPTFSLPPDPRSFPIATSFDWSTPDFFLYQPNAKIHYTGNTPFSSTPLLSLSGAPYTCDSNDYRTGFLKLELHNGIEGLYQNSNTEYVYSVFSGTNVVMQLIFLASSPGNTTIVVKSQTATGSIDGSVIVSNDRFDSVTNIFFSLPADDSKDLIVYVNGTEFVNATAEVGTFTQPLTFDSFALVSQLIALQSNFSILEARFYDDLLTETQRSLVSRGYSFNTELLQLQINNGGDNWVQNFGLALNEAIASSTVSGTARLRPDTNVPINVPIVEASYTGGTADDFMFEVLSTKALSNGTTRSSVTAKMITSVTYTDSLGLDLSEAIAESGIYVTGGSTIILSMRLFDTLTGVTGNPVEAPKKPGIKRFKAGSELSGKVK